MELCSLKSLSVSSIPRSGLLEKPFLRGRTIKPCTNKRYAEARKLRILDCRAQASGTTIVSSEAPGAALKDVDSKDSNLVFVAGATGKVGSRTVRELLKLGFRVRAGVRNRQRADSLLQSVQQMKLDDSASGGTQRKRRELLGASVTLPAIENLEIVECDLEQRDRIVPALGNSSIVICCIGASEKEVFDITGPYRIDYVATKNLIDAATFAKVDHFILLTSLGTNKVGFPAAILNLFWGVLIWKRKAEEALLASGLPYTIVRPGGMERPTDSYKETHNIMLSGEDTLFGGQVSNLQVAELMAFMAKNSRVSYCKVVEVIAETTAPLTPMGELLTKIPSQRDPPKESADADGPGPAVTDRKTAEPSSPSAVKEPSPTKPTSERPLSPYTVYEDLKPPTTPSPTPSSTTSGSEASNTKTLLTASNSPPSAVEINSSAAPSTVIESEVQREGKKTNSLSPYPNYYDLIPPTSPTPNSPSSREDTSISEPISTSPAADSEASKITKIEADPSEPKLSTVQPEITRPLSPFTAYEDLKPPSSPSPAQSGPKEASKGATISLDITSQITAGNDQARTETDSAIEKGPPPSSASRQSPYIVYENLKPPSSPSPNAPVVFGNGKPGPPLEDKSGITQKESTLKQKPLSPFTMYEDLKPPSSPSPSLKKL